MPLGFAHSNPRTSAVLRATSCCFAGCVGPAAIFNLSSWMAPRMVERSRCRADRRRADDDQLALRDRDGGLPGHASTRTGYYAWMSGDGECEAYAASTSIPHAVAFRRSTTAFRVQASCRGLRPRHRVRASRSSLVARRHTAARDRPSARATISASRINSGEAAKLMVPVSLAGFQVAHRCPPKQIISRQCRLKPSV